LREASDAVEAEGVKRALAEAASADIVLAIRACDISNDRSFESEAADLEDFFSDLAIARGEAERLQRERLIPVLNKIDLDPDLAERARASGYQVVSAQTGEGVDALREVIREKAGFTPRSNLFTARKRHLLALKEALARAEAARALAEDTLPGELIAEELRAVHASLGEIVGEMSSDALLGEIFANFCIGK
jgi:tRNA modification GTPase